MEVVLLAAFAGCSTALPHSLTTLDGECGALSENDAGVLRLRDFLRNSDQDLWRSGEESPETALYFDGMEALMRAQNTYTNASKRNEELYLAAHRFSMALLFRPDVSMLWHNLGTCILGLRQHWTAIPLWERAIELDPDNKLARQALDETMEELDRLNFETRPEDVGGTLLGSRFDGELLGAKLTNMSKFTRMTDDDIMSRFDLGDRCDLLKGAWGHAVTRLTAILIDMVALRTTSFQPSRLPRRSSRCRCSTDRQSACSRAIAPGFA